MRKLLALLFVALHFVVVLAGCGTREQPNAPASPSSAASADASAGGAAPEDAAAAPAVAADPAATPAAASAAERSARETARLNEWFEARYEEQLDFSPIQKTLLGRKDDYDRIDDVSEAAADRRLAWTRETVAALRAEFDYELLAPESQVSYDLWIDRLARAEAAYPFRRRGYQFHQMGGLHTSLPQFLITAHRVDDESDMTAYIARIGEIGRAIEQALERAKLAAAEGVHAPRFAYEAVIDSSRALVTGAPFDGAASAGGAAPAAGGASPAAGGPARPAGDSAESAAPAASAGEPSPIWADAMTKIDRLVAAGVIDDARAAALRGETAQALTQRFAPAYEDLIAWAESELPLTDEVATGVWKLPDGPRYYETSLANQTTTDLTADEIHTLGLSEVARIRAEMETIKDDVGFDGDLQAFFAFVRDDPQFFFPSTDAGRQAYLDRARMHLDFIEQRLPQYFGRLPKAGLEVRRVEAFRERPGQAQHYQAGTPDGSRPGIYYSHLIDMSAMPIPMMEVIAYHEGIPGHHMQISIAQELTDIPTFRRQAGFGAFQEGWGLYAESLAKEMGAYEDPYSDFGRLTSEIWRAIRLVVDTGLHSKRWTEADAVEYMRANSAISDGQIRAEVRRYIVMPGQATTYKIGMLKIQELRSRAETALGRDFDIREFHDLVLGGGALPLSLLERRVDDWIAASAIR